MKSWSIVSCMEMSRCFFITEAARIPKLPSLTAFFWTKEGLKGKHTELTRCLGKQSHSREKKALAAATLVYGLHCLPRKSVGFFMHLPKRVHTQRAINTSLLAAYVILYRSVSTLSALELAVSLHPLLFMLPDAKLPYSYVFQWSHGAWFPKLFFRKLNWKKARNCRVW